MSAIPRLTENSPTANLLRNSRLFSIPQRLPRPEFSERLSQSYKSSPTATTPYPTHQIITTPKSSRYRGDWGLKRSLPIKSTAKSFGIKVDALDTYDQVTEFEPAHAYVKTLEKLQQLNIVLTRPARTQNPISLRYGYTAPPTPQSAFEPKYDNVAPSPRTLDEARMETNDLSQFKLQRRWRYRGPDLRQLPQAEFDAYLTRQVEKQSHSFMRFLKAHYTHKQAAVRLSNEEYGSLEALYFQWVKSLNHLELEAYLLENSPEWLTPEESSMDPEVKSWMPAKPTSTPSFEAFLTQVDDSVLPLEFKNKGETQPSQNGESSTEQWEQIDQLLKEQPTISPQLASIAQQLESTFLHSIQPGWKQYFLSFRNTSGSDNQIGNISLINHNTLSGGDEVRELIEYFFDLPETIPQGKNDMLQLSTHGSAGLSYRRTTSILRNHPMFGPTIARDPQRARLLQQAVPTTRGADTLQFKPIAVGLAGMVVHSHDNLIIPAKIVQAESRNGESQLERRGTEKAYAYVRDAHVNHLGRINMTVVKPPDGLEELINHEFDIPKARERAFARQEQLRNADAKKVMKNPLDEKAEYKAMRAKPLNMPATGQDSAFKRY